MTAQVIALIYCLSEDAVQVTCTFDETFFPDLFFSPKRIYTHALYLLVNL